MTKKILLLTLMVFSLFILSGQETGEVLFNVYPNNALVKINEQVYKVSDQKTVTLVEGQHKIQVWAPKMEVYEEVINIVAGEKFIYKKGLSVLAPKYEAFREENSKINFKKLINTSADILIIGLNIGATYYVFSESPGRLDRYKKDAINAQERYQNALLYSELEDAENDYNIAKDQYDSGKNNHNKLEIPFLALTYGLSTYYLIRRLKKGKIQRPKYEEQNPFANALLKVSPNLTYQNNSFILKTTINF